LDNTALPTVVVGAGLAGLCTALHLADQRRVIVLAKRNLHEGATAWAQGGIVGVLGADDSVKAHVRDTQDAGAGLVDEHAARFISEGSAASRSPFCNTEIANSPSTVPHTVPRPPNTLVPPDSYIPLTVTEATSGQTVTVYNQSPATKGLFKNVYSNQPGLDANYNGGDISVNKRMSNGWSLMAGASYGKTISDVIGGDLNNPNSAAFRRGVFGNDVPWSYRLSGVVELPFRIATSATTSYYAGFPELTTVTVNSRTVALTQSSQSVVTAPRGTKRFPNVFQIDASLHRPIRLQKTTLDPRIDFYNMGNENAVQKRVTVLGPAYGRPSDVQRGRLIKFGMSVDF